MCVIIDTNVLTSILLPTSQDHSKFEPVYKWIFDGKGKIVWGGSKYFGELNKHGRYYVKLFTLLQNNRKVHQIPTEKVDKTEEELKRNFPDPKINDHHLASIVINSKCRIICTNDKESYPFLKNPSVYPSDVSRPKIYRSIRNANLIDDRHIVEFCKPSVKLSRESQVSIKNMLEKI